MALALSRVSVMEESIFRCNFYSNIVATVLPLQLLWVICITGSISDVNVCVCVCVCTQSQCVFCLDYAGAMLHGIVSCG